MNNLCGILFPGSEYDFKDDTGCLKPSGHNDAHICKTPTGETVQWEDDYDCECGCWGDDDGIVCMLYSYTSL